MMRTELLYLLVIGIIPILSGLLLVWWFKKSIKTVIILAIGFVAMAISLSVGIIIFSQLKELRFTSFDWVGVLVAYVLFTIGAVDVVFSGSVLRARKDIIFLCLSAVIASFGSLVFVPKTVIEVVGIGAISGIIGLLTLYIAASKIHTK